MQKTVMLLGSGELGKEVVIALQRLGQHVIAVDAYPGAPAMQVADAFEVVSMLDEHRTGRAALHGLGVRRHQGFAHGYEGLDRFQWGCG